MSGADEPDDGSGPRLTITRGGDPGDEVIAALAAVLTQPTVVAEQPDAATGAGDDAPARWVRAARLEGVVPGRRITTIADLAGHRAR